MQVLVLAGGIGSRMMPWTSDTPKPLLPMLDKTLLERVVESIPEEMIDEVVISGGYKAEQIEKYFAAADTGFDVRIIKESQPLGTGGAIANCSDVISGTFACFNGDVITSLNMPDMLALHKEKHSIGTLGLWEVEDPTRYGIVGLDEDSRVTRFLEKPRTEQVFSNLINAGSYILEEDVFEVMPEGKHSIERDVFPVLAEQGTLHGMQFEGYFIDAGTPSSWQDGISACIAHRETKTGEVVSDSWIGPDSIIGQSTLISNSMISKSVSIGDECLLSDSSILDDAVIGDGAIITSSLIGRDVRVAPGINLRDCVIGHGEVITSSMDGCRIPSS